MSVTGGRAGHRAPLEAGAEPAAPRSDDWRTPHAARLRKGHRSRRRRPRSPRAAARRRPRRRPRPGCRSSSAPSCCSRSSPRRRAASSAARSASVDSVPLGNLSCDKTCSGRLVHAHVSDRRAARLPVGRHRDRSRQDRRRARRELTATRRSRPPRATRAASRTRRSRSTAHRARRPRAPRTSSNGQLADQQTVRIAGSVRYASARRAARAGVDLIVTFSRAIHGSASGSACGDRVNQIVLSRRGARPRGRPRVVRAPCILRRVTRGAPGDDRLPRRPSRRGSSASPSRRAPSSCGRAASATCGTARIFVPADGARRASARAPRRRPPAASGRAARSSPWERCSMGLSQAALALCLFAGPGLGLPARPPRHVAPRRGRRHLRRPAERLPAGALPVRSESAVVAPPRGDSGGLALTPLPRRRGRRGRGLARLPPGAARRCTCVLSARPSSGRPCPSPSRCARARGTRPLESRALWVFVAITFLYGLTECVLRQLGRRLPERGPPPRRRDRRRGRGGVLGRARRRARGRRGAASAACGRRPSSRRSPG